MEYSLSGGSEWKPCMAGSTEGIAPGKYLVRVAAVEESSFASEAAEVEIKKIHRTTIENIGNGTAEANPKDALKGTEILLKPTPDSGHYFKGWQVVSPLSGVNIANNKFTMPESDVEIKALSLIHISEPTRP